MKKILFVLIVVITALSLTACFRSRRSNTIQVDAPTVASNTQTEQTALSTPTPQTINTATSVSTEVVLPTNTPEVVVTPTQSPSSAAAEASKELDQTLSELEQLLNNTDTKVDIP
ncbi:MAG: hypothetical protein U0Z26_01360 [Anaerolineales bacterium]